MDFGQGLVVRGGYRSMFCGAMPGNSDNCSYNTTSLFL